MPVELDYPDPLDLLRIAALNVAGANAALEAAALQADVEVYGVVVEPPRPWLAHGEIIHNESCGAGSRNCLRVVISGLAFTRPEARHQMYVQDRLYRVHGDAPFHVVTSGEAFMMNFSTNRTTPTMIMQSANTNGNIATPGTHPCGHCEKRNNGT